MGWRVEENGDESWWVKSRRWMHWEFIYFVFRISISMNRRWLISQNKWEQHFWLIESNFKKMLSYDLKWQWTFQRWEHRFVFSIFLVLCVCVNTSVHRVVDFCFWLCVMLCCVCRSKCLSNIYVQSKSFKWKWPKMDFIHSMMHVEEKEYQEQEKMGNVFQYSVWWWILPNCMCCVRVLYYITYCAYKWKASWSHKCMNENTMTL